MKQLVLCPTMACLFVNLIAMQPDENRDLNVYLQSATVTSEENQNALNLSDEYSDPNLEYSDLDFETLETQAESLSSNAETLD